jgi:hypothetical protein
MDRMPRRPSPLPAGLGDVFTVSEALAAGVTLARLRSPDLLAPFPGVRVRSSAAQTPDDPDDDRSPLAREARTRRFDLLLRAHAYAKVMPGPAVFSNVTAAAIWGLPLPISALRGRWNHDQGVHEPRPVELVVPPPHRAPRTAGVAARQRREDVARRRERDGFVVSSPASTWAQLGGILTMDDLIAAGDALVHVPRTSDGRRGDPASSLASLDDLRAAVRAPRISGLDPLITALPLVRVGCASSAETRLRLAVARAGLPDPTLDFEVRAPTRELVGVTELAFEQWRLLVEYEGDHHRIDRAQWHRDIEKHRAYAELGWTVLRLAARDLYPDAGLAVGLIRDALHRTGWRG